MKKQILILLSVILAVTIFSAQGFAEQTKNLTFASAKFVPFSSPDLLNQGFYTEICTEALKRVGYEVDLKFMPFPRVLKSASSGKVDGALGIFHSKDREKTFLFSDHILSLDISFFKMKKSDIKFEKLEDLKGYTIGVTRGGRYTPEFTKAAYLKKDETTGATTNLKKLISGRVDLVVTPKISGFLMIKESFPEMAGAIDTLPKPLSSNKMYIAISKKTKDAEVIMKDFNRGLKMLREDGTFDNILKKHDIVL